MGFFNNFFKEYIFGFFQHEKELIFDLLKILFAVFSVSNQKVKYIRKAKSQSGFIFRDLKSQKKQPDVDFLGHENTIEKNRPVV